jgi:hypothetical protein
MRMEIIDGEVVFNTLPADLPKEEDAPAIS